MVCPERLGSEGVRETTKEIPGEYSLKNPENGENIRSLR
jgi:hypothetical protein